MLLSRLLADARAHAPEVFGAAGLRPADDGSDPVIEAVVHSHAAAVPGALFVARRGERFDANDYSADAVASGAVAVVGERPTSDLQVPYLSVADARRALPHLAAAFYGHPSLRLRVLGVTGTDGKTTTSYLLQQILSSRFRSGLISTAGIRLGDEEQPTLGHFTTPEATDVQRLLAGFLDSGATHAVLESSSHGFSLNRLDAVTYRSGIVTNLAPEHLDHHKTLEAYFDAKATLLRRSQRAVINLDDPHHAGFADIAADTGSDVITYGQSSAADVRIGAVSSVPGGLEFPLHTASDSVDVSLPMIGAYNAWNAAAAVAAALGEGVDAAEAAATLERFAGVPGRMQVIQAEPYTVVIDFAHTAPALAKALLAVGPAATGRLIVVIGAAGERDPGKRQPLGSAAIEGADFAVFTEEDSRSEPFAAIAGDLVRGAEAAGGASGRQFAVIPDRTQAIAEALTMAGPGDVVLLAGKGHERTLERAHETLVWDEAALVGRLLRGR